MAELYETIAQMRDKISLKEKACHRKAKMIYKMRMDGHSVMVEEKKLFNLVDQMEVLTLKGLAKVGL